MAIIPSLATLALRAVPEGGKNPFFAQNGKQIIQPREITLATFAPQSIKDATFATKVIVQVKREEISKVAPEKWSRMGICCCFPFFLFDTILSHLQINRSLEEWECLRQSEIVKEIDLEPSRITSLTIINGFTKIRKLNIAHASLTSLKGIETLHYLEVINVSYVKGDRSSNELREPNWGNLNKALNLKKIIAASTEVFNYLLDLSTLRHLETLDISENYYVTRIQRNRTHLIDYKFEMTTGVVDLKLLYLFPKLKLVNLTGTNYVKNIFLGKVASFHLIGGEEVEATELQLMQKKISDSKKLPSLDI